MAEQPTGIQSSIEDEPEAVVHSPASQELQSRLEDEPTTADHVPATQLIHDVEEVIEE